MVPSAGQGMHYKHVNRKSTKQIELWYFNPALIHVLDLLLILEIHIRNFPTWILLQCLILSSCGIVFVTTTASKLALLIREMAGPEKIPWVKIAYTFVAPADTSLRQTHSTDGIKSHRQTHTHKSCNSSFLQKTCMHPIMCYVSSLVSCMTYRPTRVCHIVDQNGHSVLHIPNQHHPVYLVRFLPLLMNKGKVHVQPISDGCHSDKKTQLSANVAKRFQMGGPRMHLCLSGSITYFTERPHAQPLHYILFTHSSVNELTRI